MNDDITTFPKNYHAILNEAKKLKFDQNSDSRVGALLATLCASKPEGYFIELGTGTGLSTAWMLRGMCPLSSLLSIDNNQQLMGVAQQYLGDDKRVEFMLGDGEGIIDGIQLGSVDLIFADTWPGKYSHLDETLALLKDGGMYVIDDMEPQDNWPEGHDVKAKQLIATLEGRSDLAMVAMDWSTGVLICTKRI